MTKIHLSQIESSAFKISSYAGPSVPPRNSLVLIYDEIDIISVFDINNLSEDDSHHITRCNSNISKI